MDKCKMGHTKPSSSEDIMEHTKGKWWVVNDDMILGRSVGGCQMQEDDFMIAQIRGWGHLQYLGEEKGIEIQEANARRIVQCVNSYDGLVEALDKIRKEEKYRRKLCDTSDLSSPPIPKGIIENIAIEAIAEAEKTE